MKCRPININNIYRPEVGVLYGIFLFTYKKRRPHSLRK